MEIGSLGNKNRLLWQRKACGLGSHCEICYNSCFTLQLMLYSLQATGIQIVGESARLAMQRVPYIGMVHIDFNLQDNHANQTLTPQCPPEVVSMTYSLSVHLNTSYIGIDTV